MIHNDDGSIDLKGNLLPFEEGSVAGDPPGTIFVDSISSLDLNEYNLDIGKYRSLDDSCLDATYSCLQMFVPAVSWPHRLALPPGPPPLDSTY
eukprot:7949599-Ditylum_brightwellii.AAC.1